MEIYVDQKFVAGRKYLIFTSSVVLLLGIIEIIASLVTLRDTSGHYIGGWYLGMFCTFAGIRGSYLSGRRALNWLVVLSFFALIVCVIGTSLQAANYNFVNSLQACSEYSDGVPNTCQTYGGNGAYNMTGYTCTGNDDYYPQAYACELSWVLDGSDTSDECSCVSSTDSTDCYNYENMNSCTDLLNKAPKDLHACYAVGILCLIACIVLLFLATASLKSPLWLATQEEIDAGEEEYRESLPTVAVVTVTSPAHMSNAGDAYVLNPTEVFIVQPGNNNNNAYVYNTNNGGRGNNNVAVMTPTVVETNAPVQGRLVTPTTSGRY